MADARLSEDGRSVTVRVPMAFAKRGGRKLVISPEGVSSSVSTRPRVDNALVKALARVPVAEAARDRRPRHDR